MYVSRPMEGIIAQTERGKKVFHSANEKVEPGEIYSKREKNARAITS